MRYIRTRTKVFSILFVVLLSFAGASRVQAVTIDELLAQVDTLVRLVASLQAQIKTLSSNGVVSNDVPSNTTSSLLPFGDYDICINPPVRSLKNGDDGFDVLALQEFLRDTAGYDGILGGHFGDVTESAVKRFQVQEKIVSSGTPSTTGFGVVGPRTQARIKLFCTGEKNIQPATASEVSYVPPPTATPVVPAYCPTAPVLPATLCGASMHGVPVYARDGCHTGWVCSANNSTSVDTNTPSSVTNTTYTGNTAPIIESITGPTEVLLHETGVWTISAKDAESDVLRYKIFWGDEQSATGFDAISSLATQNTFSEQKSFSHAYSLSGVYALRAVVQDSSGLTVERTLSVRVGGSSGSCYSNITLYPEGSRRACITQDGGGGTMCAPTDKIYVCRSNEWSLENN